MRKRLLFTLFAFLFCSTMFGQNYYVPVNTGQYSTSTTIISVISFDGVEQGKELELGVFCNDEVRASVRTLYNPFRKRYIATVSVKGQSGDAFKFKVYDHSTNTEWSNDCTITYVDKNGVTKVAQYLTFDSENGYGSSTQPCTINFNAPLHWIPNTSFENAMIVSSTVKIDNITQQNSGYELGVFCGDEVRGSAELNNDGTVNAIVYGVAGEVFTFNLYDPNKGEGFDNNGELIFTEVNNITFNENGYFNLEVNFITAPYVAQIGEDKYFTLEEAFAAAQDGQTVTLLTDATGPGVEIKKDITIDLNGHDYIVSEGAFDISAVVRLQNGIFTHATEGANVVNIQNGAQLYLQEGIKGTMTKSVVGTDTGWGTISSPVGTVEHVKVTGLLSATGTHDMYRYNETNSMYENVKDTSNVNFTTLEAGNGYLYANTENTDVVFEGTFNTKAPKMSLSYTESSALAGFNLIGNPYTHNIDDSHFTLSNDAQLSYGFYVISEEGAWTAKAANATIAPMESVFVKTSKETELTINKDASSKSRSANNGMLAINVTNEQYSDVAYVSFNEGLGLDKISHRNSEIPMVYVPVEGVDYAIAMMNRDVTEIPVSFKAMTMGEYTISAEGIDCEFSQLTLVDRMTGVETNLLLEDYSFMAKSGDNAERFIIRLQHSANANTTSENFVYVNNDELIINNIEGASVVRILDVLGRPVAEYNVYESANISTASFRSGVYMVQMSGENGVKVQKIIID